MVMIGADIEELRLASRVFEQRASDIADHIEPSLGDALTRTTWSGIDADRFKSLWFSSLSPSLKSVAGELDKAAKTLRNNADAQEATSRDGGAIFGGGGSGWSSSAQDGSEAGSGDPVPNGGKGMGKSTWANPEGYTQPRTGAAGFIRDVMDLAQACYNHEVGDSHDGMIPAGWEEVSADELRKLGLSRDEFGVPGDDFSATLYRDVNGAYVLAFEGSNLKDSRDVDTNIYGQTDVTAQDMRAVWLAQAVKKALIKQGVSESSIVLAGHSLGGRLASVASVATGLRAYGFNSAGVSEKAFEFARKFREDMNYQCVDRESAGRNIDHIVINGDPVNLLQTVGIDRAPIGKVHYFEIPQEELSTAQKYLIGADLEKKHDMGSVKAAWDKACAKKGVNMRDYS